MFSIFFFLHLLVLCSLKFVENSRRKSANGSAYISAESLQLGGKKQHNDDSTNQVDVDGSAFQSCRAVPCAVTVQATVFAAAGARSCCQVERGWAEGVSGAWGRRAEGEGGRGAAGHQRCWLLKVKIEEMWGSFATRLKWGQLVCEVEAECSAFMSCSWVTLGDLNFINRIDFIALRKKKERKEEKNWHGSLQAVGTQELYEPKKRECCEFQGQSLTQPANKQKEGNVFKCQ